MTSTVGESSENRLASLSSHMCEVGVGVLAGTPTPLARRDKNICNLRFRDPIWDRAAHCAPLTPPQVGPTRWCRKGQHPAARAQQPQHQQIAEALMRAPPGTFAEAMRATCQPSWSSTASKYTCLTREKDVSEGSEGRRGEVNMTSSLQRSHQQAQGQAAKVAPCLQWQSVRGRRSRCWRERQHLHMAGDVDVAAVGAAQALQRYDVMALLQDHHVLLWQAGSREPFFCLGELFASCNSASGVISFFFGDVTLLARRFSRLP